MTTYTAVGVMDILTGGTGKDFFIYGIGDYDSGYYDGDDTITDFQLGQDELSLSSFWNAWKPAFWDMFGNYGDSIRITDHGNDAFIEAHSGGGLELTITLAGLAGLAGTTLDDMKDTGSIEMW